MTQPINITRTTPLNGPAWVAKPVLKDGGWFDGETGEHLIALKQNTVDTLVDLRNGVEAEGEFTFTANPSAGHTLVLNGVTWTFVADSATGAQTNIGVSLTATLTQLVTDLNASVNASLAVATYSKVGTTKLKIVHDTPGTDGNAYTLVSGNANAVRSAATLTGGKVDKRVKATGFVQFAANPANNQTIVINGVTWTFKTSGATGTQTNLGVSLAATLTQLVTDLNASGNTSIDDATYSTTTGKLVVTHDTFGPTGNAFTLGKGTGASAVSAATLTGGTN